MENQATKLMEEAEEEDNVARRQNIEKLTVLIVREGKK